MLEDDPTRLQRFFTVVREISPDLELTYWRNARRMVRESRGYLSSCALICLDHDLEPEEGEDPGDGLEVARFLAPLRLKCPILIHSSNGDRVRMMVGTFELEECQVSTILPLGADWIESHWRRRVEELLGSKRKSLRTS